MVSNYEQFRFPNFIVMRFVMRTVNH